jgi:CHAT domain-containing protein/tetratricopeptide (TPR) repeat protein
MVRYLVLFLSAVLFVSGARASTAPPDALAAGFRAYDTDDLAAARKAFEQALADAQRSGDRSREARARRGLGMVLVQRAEYGPAVDELNRALAIDQQIGDALEGAHVQFELAVVHVYQGDWAAGRTAARAAQAEFERAGEDADEARMLLWLRRDPAVASAASRDLLVRAGTLARRSNNPKVLAEVEHDEADDAFARGDYATAMARLQSAIAIFERVHARANLPRALTSLGRLYRIHGEPSKAIGFYRRALKIQHEIHDQEGVIQTINAIAVAEDALGRGEAALRDYRRALTLARETGSARIIAFQLGNLGGSYVDQHQYQRAVPLLRQALERPNAPFIVAIRYNQLAEAYLNLGRNEESLDAIARAIEYDRRHGNNDSLTGDLQLRARAYRALGRTKEALDDVRDALKAFEIQRSHIVPSDALKQGFAERHQRLFALAVDLLEARHEARAALETAAEAEARAFLDLLASRGLDGAAAAAASARDSGATAPAPGVAEITETLRRRRSTLLAYFVTDRATFVWVVGPDGAVHDAVVPIAIERLRALIARTRPNESSAPSSAPKLVARGARPFFAGATSPTAWRALDRLLVGPVRRWLPASGGRLTIVPHGPLLRLSFAALRDAAGRYLIEQYAIHYVPSVGVLRFTAGRSGRETPQAPRYLLVGAPAGARDADTGAPLPPLPGARREIARIAAMLPADRTTVLTGARADEPHVLSDLASASVVHLAAHAIVEPGDPLSSYVALHPGAGQDGRLTAAAIYGLTLHADEVVLSACGTALGRVSPDGIAGLTRAFLSAGAASVVATLWDVADEPTFRLVPSLYRLRRSGAGKAEALRAAQLALLADLRAGRVRIGGPHGAALPEDPFFWAGFVLVGEP